MFSVPSEFPCDLCVELIARDHVNGLNQSVGVARLAGRRMLRRVLARLAGLLSDVGGVGFFTSAGAGVGDEALAAATGSVAPASPTQAAQPPSRACTCV